MGSEKDRDPIDELGRELREKVAGEFRRTAEEDEHAVRKSALRKRDLAQVAYELLSRGDVVRAKVGEFALRGVVTHARGSLATVTPDDGPELHVNLAGPVLLEVVERSNTGGRSRQPFGPESFIARLRELELTETPLAIYLGFTSVTPVGRIEAVAADHIMLVGDSTHFVAVAAIAGVRAIA